jgi:hypothetical protein
MAAEDRIEDETVALAVEDYLVRCRSACLLGVETRPRDLDRLVSADLSLDLRALSRPASQLRPLIQSSVERRSCSGAGAVARA